MATFCYHQACQAGDTYGCTRYSELLEHSSVEAKSGMLTRQEALEIACDGREWASCGLLGDTYNPQISTASWPALAVEYYRRACEGNQWDRCYTAASLLFVGGDGLEKNTDEAIVLYNVACDKGIFASCGELGQLYYEGVELEKDDETALRLLRRAHNGGELHRAVSIGLILESGEGVKRDRDAAQRYFQEACTDGAMKACHRAGLYYFGEESRVEDSQRALEFFTTACDREYGPACQSLGDHYRERYNQYSCDAEKLISAYSMGCRYGDPDSCNSLAEYYLNEPYRPIDRDKYQYYFERACTLDAECSTYHCRYSAGRGCNESGRVHTAQLLGKTVEERCSSPTYTEAVDDFYKACDLGYLPGCLHAGELLSWSGCTNVDPVEVVEVFSRGCHGTGTEFDQHGNPASCVQLGSLIEFGVGADRNEREALRLYRLACDRRSSAGCAAAARLFSSGKGTTKDLGKALEYYEAACALADGSVGNRECGVCAQYYENGISVQQDLERALRYYEIACSADFHSREETYCIHLGTHLVEAGDFEGAKDAFERACSGKHNQGCVQAGRLYLDDNSPFRSYSTGVKYLNKACDGENGIGCLELGEFIEDNGLAWNPIEKLDWSSAQFYQRSCELDEGAGCVKIGLAHFGHIETTVQPDDEAAYAAFKRSCDLGNMEGCNALAICHELGSGTSVDVRAARDAYRRACDGGYSVACVNRGDLSYFGRLGEKNLRSASKYYDKACRLGSPRGCSLRDSTEEKRKKEEDRRSMLAEEEEGLAGFCRESPEVCIVGGLAIITTAGLVLISAADNGDDADSSGIGRSDSTHEVVQLTPEKQSRADEAATCLAGCDALKSTCYETSCVGLPDGWFYPDNLRSTCEELCRQSHADCRSGC